MAVRILFLGPLEDIAGAPELALPAPLDWDGLLSAVNSETLMHLQSDRIKVACSGKVLADKFALLAADGEEVALLPPVSGG